MNFAGLSASEALEQVRAHAAAGKFHDALDGYSALLASAPGTNGVRKEFGQFLTNCAAFRPRPNVDAILIHAIEQAWIRPDDLALPVIRYLSAKWPGALDGASNAGQAQLLSFLRDPLLLVMLRMTTMLTPGIEILLARFRLSALKAIVAGQDLNAYLPTLTAIAIRGWHTGYALTLPLIDRHEADFSLERELVARLSDQVADGETSGDQISAALAVLGCYQRLDIGVVQTALNDADPVATVLEENVLGPFARQRAIAQALAPITPIDANNQILIDQYKAHPYPAWISEPDEEVILPPAALAALGDGAYSAARSVLIAGCGTGQHALAAARTWREAKVLAIDLSRTSLSYAIDKANDAGIDNIEFALADLLQLEVLDRRFDVVEAMGVLHHLDDPQAGLDTLARLTKTDGLIGIALYAAAARTWLTEIRERYGIAEISTDDEIRRFRSWALAQEDLTTLHYSQDFYSIGGCRDALFHVREHAYSMHDVGEMLEKAGLHLLAVQPPPNPALFDHTLPEPDDLAGWHALELAQPNLFITMYEIWARRKPPN